MCSYLDHAAVDGHGGANHVHVGRGGGALPLGEPAARGRVRRGVVEGMRGGVPVGRAAEGREDGKRDDGAATRSFVCLFTSARVPSDRVNRNTDVWSTHSGSVSSQFSTFEHHPHCVVPSHAQRKTHKSTTKQHCEEVVVI